MGTHEHHMHHMNESSNNTMSHHAVGNNKMDNMSEHNMTPHHVPGHDITGHDMSGHDMTGHDMAGHDMTGHDMSGHDMSGHDMTGHDMTGHDMSAHDMSAHDMAGHDMAGHDMTGHDMSGHDMTGHDMAGHDMSGHDMTGHDMSGHDMTGHDMSGHDMTEHLHHHDNAALHHHHDHPHPMTFHARNDDYILFSDWRLSPGKVTFFVCLALVLLAVIYQCIKMVRARLGRKCPNTQCKRYILSKNHMIQTAFYMIQFVIGYMLMLAVMTYNVWVMVAAIVGVGLGYFFFGWAEYEETVRLQPITMKSSARARAFKCGTTGDQELLPLSKDSSAVSDVTVLTSNIACACEDNEI